MISAKWFCKARLNIHKGLIDLSSDAIKVALCGAGYAPNQGAHETFDDIADEVTGSGYIAGGQVLRGTSLTLDPASNVVKFDADDPVWPNATITARTAVLYDDSTTPKYLLAYQRSDVDVSSTGADWRLTWNAGGILKDTIS